MANIQQITLFILYTCYFFGVRSEFNREVSARVQDFIADYLEIVTRSAYVPYNCITYGNVAVNLSRPLETSMKLLYQSKTSFPESSSIYIGFETGLFYGYIVQTYQVVAVPATKKLIAYSLNRNGSAGHIVSSSSFDPRTRPWYIGPKNAKGPTWIPAYISAATGTSLFSFGIPLYLNTSGTTKTLIGVLSVAAYLTDLTNFLVKAYQNTDKQVFIVEAASGQLMASTLGIPVNVKSSTGVLQAVYAATCSSPLISGVTTLLASQGWPSTLTIYDGYYLQSTLYKDTRPGICWYVVVLMPAVKDEEFLARSSPLYTGVIIMVAITAAFATFGLVTTIYLRNSRLIKLTGPIFTLMIIFGSYLLCASCIALLSENNAENCAVRPWLFHLAFTATFSPLLIKAWRVHLIFNKKPLTKNKVISPSILISYTIIFIVFDVVILASTLYTGTEDGTKPQSELKQTSNGAYGKVIYCGYTTNLPFYSAEIAYKGTLILAACYLSFKIRRLAGTIAGSKSLLAIVYNVAFLTVVVLLVDQSVTDVAQVVFIQCIGICVGVFNTLAILILPNLYHLYTLGDEAAAEEVIDEVFHRRSGVLSSGQQGAIASSPDARRQLLEVGVTNSHTRIFTMFNRNMSIRTMSFRKMLSLRTRRRNSLGVSKALEEDSARRGGKDLALQEVRPELNDDEEGVQKREEDQDVEGASRNGKGNKGSARSNIGKSVRKLVHHGSFTGGRVYRPHPEGFEVSETGRAADV